MPNKVLIGYATKCGSTIEVAEAIGDTICQDGIKGEFCPMNKVADLSGYDGVILGSAIRMGQWLSAAKDFVKRHQDLLNQIPTAIFSVHILNLGDDPESEKERLAYTVLVKKMITPRDEAFFAGKIDPTQLNFFERLLFKAVKSPPGVFRDWDKIRSWAGEIFV